MFIRFTRGRLPADQYLKAVLLGDCLVVEFGNEIVGVAKLYEETDKCRDWDIVVAAKCPLGGDNVAKKMKDIIGRSNKYSINPSNKKRKYYVESLDTASVPVEAKIRLISK